MQHRYISIALVAALAAGACSDKPLPVFMDPVPASVPAGQPALGPRLVKGPRDTVILSWMEHGDDPPRLLFSRYTNGSWQPAIEAVADPQMFVNWADLPAVQPTGRDRLLAHWLSYAGDEPYAYQVLTSWSDDSGQSWSKPTSPHDDGTPTEHGFVSTYPAPAGTGMIWLDGRETPEGGMTLRGAVVSGDGGITDETLLDDLVCDCCQTSVALTDNGAVAVYRNRTEDEVRDIYLARQADGRWQPGEAIANDGWVISGCPVNGPAIDTSDDLVAIAWFTAADNKPVVKTAFSKNSGKAFSEPVLVSTRSPQGHVGVAAIDRHSYVVSWLEKEKDDSYAIKIRGLTSDGKVGLVYTVGRTALAHIVPQLLRSGDELLLAWTDEIAGLSKVVSVRVPIAGFYD
ncbi:MAG TPA: sialidase family protein [Woeseiaceae bacterium]|nr:sialidase family protein [Woeseiaceae bacterium]